MRVVAVWAFALGLALGCEDDHEECSKPADCVTAPGANTCKKVGGKNRCVLTCAGEGTPCMLPGYVCSGTSDDGTRYCVR